MFRINETKTKIAQIISRRFKILEDCNNKIEELKVIKESICNDLKRLYISVSEASTLYEELLKCRKNHTKEQEKTLLSYLRVYLGCDKEFKFDTNNIIDHNYSKAYSIYFTYKKRKYYLQCPCTEKIDASNFDDPNCWKEELGMTLYRVDGSNSSTLLGGALTRESLQELVEKEILKNGH